MTDVFISWEDTKDPQACRTNPDVFDQVSIYSSFFKDFSSRFEKKIDFFLNHFQFSRDPARTPMQWDDTKNAGFSFGNSTWLSVANNYTECNVKLQKSQVRSHLKVFRQLMAIRQNPTMKYGGLTMHAVNNDVLVYKREIDGQKNADVFVILLNLGTEYKTVELSYYFKGLPEQMKVVAVSIHSETLVIG